MQAFSLNQQIGEYRLIDVIGAGGMGTVYRAVHSTIGRTVAIKVLGEVARDPSFIERFRNEAMIQASLQHPNIATLYDFREQNGHPCLIMEYVEGPTLSDYLRAHGALSSSDAQRVFKSVLEAIQYVHSRGVIHRDIKSSNIKVTSTGQIKLLDFGIAKGGLSPRLTQTGAFVGTLQYLSPEQFCGGRADSRTDIWALGVLLYEMATGLLPFEATTIGELYEKVSSADFRNPRLLNPDIAPPVSSTIARCLRKNPQERYQSVDHILQEMDRSTATHQRPPRSPSGSDRAQAYIPAAPAGSKHKTGVGEMIAGSALSRRKWVFGLAATVILSVALVFLFLTMQRTTSGANKTYTIDTTGGAAEVYKEGARVGVTPYEFDGTPGQRIDVILKRAGYLDMPVRFSVSENKRMYLFTMEERQ